MKISLNLNDTETTNILLALGKKPCNQVTISQYQDGSMSISHHIEYPHEFLKLFRVILEGDYVEEFMDQLPKEILQQALSESEQTKNEGIDELELDNPAILPSEVLNEKED